MAHGSSQTSLYISDICAACSGLATHGSRHNLALGFIQRTLFAASGFLIVYAVLLHLYFSFSSGFSFIHLARILYNVITSKTLMDAHLKGHKFDPILEELLIELGPNLARKIKRAQIISLVTFILGIILINGNLVRIALAGNKAFHDIEILLHGKRTMDSRLLTVLSYLDFEMMVLSSILSYLHYITVQTLLQFYSKKCEIEFAPLALKGNVGAICKSCRFFNRVRLVSNEVMGFVPFHAFVMKWIFFVIGVTMAINNRDKYSYSTLLILFCLIITDTLVLLKTVFTVSRANSNMSRARKAVGEILSISSDLLPPSRLTRWNMYFIHDPVVPATLWHFFEIRPSLILISYNSMVTFAVMVLTTASAFLK